MSKIHRPPKPIGGSQPVTEIRLHPNAAQRIAAFKTHLAQVQEQVQQQIQLSLVSVIEATPGADANGEWTLSEDGTRIMRKVAEAPADPQAQQLRELNDDLRAYRARIDGRPGKNDLTA